METEKKGHVKKPAKMLMLITHWGIFAPVDPFTHNPSGPVT